MTYLDLLQQDRRVLLATREKRSVVVVARAGWWPALATYPGIRAAWHARNELAPEPTAGGRWPDVVGMRCTVPAFHVPGRQTSRRWHGTVRSQSACGKFIGVLLDDGPRATQCRIDQARDWGFWPKYFPDDA